MMLWLVRRVLGQQERDRGGVAAWAAARPGRRGPPGARRAGKIGRDRGRAGRPDVLHERRVQVPSYHAVQAIRVRLPGRLAWPRREVSDGTSDGTQPRGRRPAELSLWPPLGQLADDPDHLGWIKRLGQVGIHADFAAPGLVVFLGPRGDQDHFDPACLGIATQLTSGYPAI